MEATIEEATKRIRVIITAYPFCNSNLQKVEKEIAKGSSPAILVRALTIISTLISKAYDETLEELSHASSFLAIGSQHRFGPGLPLMFQRAGYWAGLAIVAGFTEQFPVKLDIFNERVSMEIYFAQKTAPEQTRRLIKALHDRDLENKKIAQEQMVRDHQAGGFAFANRAPIPKRVREE